jgi:SAM-dependent methyltransferase
MTCIPEPFSAKSPISRETSASNPPTRAASAPNFDHLARPYRWLEYLTFGPLLWQTRTHFLSQLAHCRRALILGDGDGRFTARLLRANSQIQVHAIDASPEMLGSLQREAGSHAHRVTHEIADLRHWHPDPSIQYDLIATHFFLDCLTTPEVADLAHRLNPATAPNVLWLVSEFAIPQTRFGSFLAAPLVSFLYFAFRLLTSLGLTHLPDHQKSLCSAGWALQSSHPHLNGLLLSELWSATFGPTPFQENESLRDSHSSL